MEHSLLHRILIVDDDPDYRKIIQLLLEGTDYFCETAGSAVEAFEALRRCSFDLVVSDVCMSGKDGLQLAREAKKEFPDLDFIIMTGYSEKYTYSDIIEAGASDYMTKPFSSSELKAKLERIAREKSIFHRLREANSALFQESSLNSSLAELSNTVITSTCLDEVSQMVLKRAKELTDSQFGCIAHFADGVKTYPADMAGPGEYSENREIILSRLGWLWNRGIRERSAALNYSPRAGGASHKAGFRYLSVPALCDGRLLGQLALVKTQKDYEEWDLRVARRLAVVYALVLQRWLAENELKEAHIKVQSMLDKIVSALTCTLEIRDPHTAGHQNRVAKLSCAIACRMGFENGALEKVKMAGLIHDIGKIYVPSELLSKPTKLMEVEMNLIRYHSTAGYEILRNAEMPGPIAEIVLQHHERINGAGYPKGLREEQILLESQIIAVADVYEAMISHRPYRPSLGKQAAIEELSRNKGLLYNADAVDVCLGLLSNEGFDFNDGNGNGARQTG
jgi:putative nucleotidyltransferase with HDIG domain